MNHNSEWGELKPTTTDKHKINAFRISKDSVTIGRHKSNDIQIVDERYYIPKVLSKNLCLLRLSGLHCKLRRERDSQGTATYFVEDHSINGTYINDEKVILHIPIPSSKF